MTKTYSNLIDGELVTTDQTMDVINPANEEVIGRCPPAARTSSTARLPLRAGLQELVARPRGRTPKVVQGIAAAIKDNGDELYRLLTTEQGKPHAQAQQEIDGAAGLAAAQAGLELDDVINRTTRPAIRAPAAFPWASSAVSCRGISRS